METMPTVRPARDIRPTREMRQLLKDTAAMIGPREARPIVDTYYQLQKVRICTGNRLSAGERGVDDPPMVILAELHKRFKALEGIAAEQLQAFAESEVVGQWAMSIRGVGPIISAGLLAHIDITRAPTVGNIWRLAGLDSTDAWFSESKAEDMVAQLNGKLANSLVELEQMWPMLNQTRMTKRLNFIRQHKDGTAGAPLTEKPPTKSELRRAVAMRPHNARLKTLCFKIGDSFVKQSGKDDDVYGHVYLQRKADEQARNEGGVYADQAAAVIKRTPTHKQAATYKKGKLSDNHIHMRAMRYSVKLFLAHFHHVAYESHYGTPPPKPYVIEHGGHTKFIGPPNWPMG